MRKVKIGVFGAGRGSSMVKYCQIAQNAELVALCDKWEVALQTHKEAWQDDRITYYTDFEEFIKHDMDAVVLSNYANEHAPFAIKAIKAGKHVFSEVLPAQHMKEAIELVETVEAHDRIYAFGENFCYMHAPYEMRKLYKAGVLGELEYAECEYVHNCQLMWPALTCGDPKHWRNNMSANFYCSHSIGPIIHCTGLRPVSVTGFESTMTARNRSEGAKGGQFGIEMLTLENGAIVKSLHGELYRDNLWYSMYGSKGRMESGRHDSHLGTVGISTGGDSKKIFSGLDKLYVNVDDFPGQYKEETVNGYFPQREFDDLAAQLSHAGSDFYSMWHFVEKILGNENADTIDVYEAMDIVLSGMFAFRSCRNGGIPMKIPNLRLQEDRDKYRNDTTCTDPVAAGDMYVSPHPAGQGPIADEVYEEVRSRWNQKLRYNLKKIRSKP